MKKAAIFLLVSLAFAQSWNIGLTFWFEGLTVPEAASFFDICSKDSQLQQTPRFKTISDYGSWADGKWEPSGCEKVTVFWEDDEPFYECITTRGSGKDFTRGNSFPDIVQLVGDTLYTYDLNGFAGFSFVPDTMWCTIDYIGETECFAFLARERGMHRMMEYFKLFMTRNKAIVSNMPPQPTVEISDDPFTDEFPLSLDSLWEAAKHDTFIVWRRSRPERLAVDVDSDGIAEVLYWLDNQSGIRIYRMGTDGPKEIFSTSRNLFVQPIALVDVTGDGKKELFSYLVADEGTDHRLVVFSLVNGNYVEAISATMFKTP